MATLSSEPGLYDVDGWRALVDELRAAPPEEVNATQLFCAEVHLAAISAPISIPPQETATETA